MNADSADPLSELEERLRIETLIAHLSLKFINLPAGEVEREIMDAERRICDRLSLDISALCQLSDETRSFFTLFPVSPRITADSIISTDGDDQPAKGGDGAVKYAGAHVPYVECEFITRSCQRCLDQPATTEEVRRILHEHLKHLDSEPVGIQNEPGRTRRNIPGQGCHQTDKRRNTMSIESASLPTTATARWSTAFGWLWSPDDDNC